MYEDVSEQIQCQLLGSAKERAPLIIRNCRANVAFVGGGHALCEKLPGAAACCLCSQAIVLVTKYFYALQPPAGSAADEIQGASHLALKLLRLMSLLVSRKVMASDRL